MVVISATSGVNIGVMLSHNALGHHVFLTLRFLDIPIHVSSRMAQDVTEIVKTLHSRELFLGITFEQLVLILYPLFLIPAVFFWYRDLRRRRFTSGVPVGCTRLGLKGISHITDEFDKKYDEGTKEQSKWRVKALYVHPIKSCASVELDEADVDVEGFTYDRKFAFAEWMLDKDQNGEKNYIWKFRTLRQTGYEKLALVRPEVWIPRKDHVVGQGNLRRVEQEGCLIIRYPNVPDGFLAPLDRLMLRWGLIPKENSFSVPLHPAKNHKYPLETVNIWNDFPKWLNMAEHVPNDFKEWLGVKNALALFRADPENYRNLFKCAPREDQVGFQPVVAFPDSYPLHLLNIASVHEVGKQVGDVIDRLSVRRFRPNILVEGPVAYDEDDWKLVSIAGNELYASCHTTRCKVRIPLLFVSLY